MQRFIIVLGVAFLSLAPLARADISQVEEPSYSRALQQAKRVAVMENAEDLPSRAYLLGSRVVKNSKRKWQAVNTEGKGSGKSKSKKSF